MEDGTLLWLSLIAMSVSSWKYFSECIFGVVWRFACSCSHMFTKRLQALGVVGSEASVDNGKRAITQLHRRFSTFLHHPSTHLLLPILAHFFLANFKDCKEGGCVGEICNRWGVAGCINGTTADICVRRWRRVATSGDVDVAGAQKVITRRLWQQQTGDGFCKHFQECNRIAAPLATPLATVVRWVNKMNPNAFSTISKSHGRHLSAVSRTSRGRECSWECQIKWELAGNGSENEEKPLKPFRRHSNSLSLSV